MAEGCELEAILPVHFGIAIICLECETYLMVVLEVIRKSECLVKVYILFKGMDAMVYDFVASCSCLLHFNCFMVTVVHTLSSLRSFPPLRLSDSTLVLVSSVQCRER
ncbi:hypothetical protein DFS33DRAFT_40568 [Desarmillaria ectypa]|nr:hypothetical protein DFS33DRAFT_40568 [Desarmillaria ectypa]